MKERISIAVVLLVVVVVYFCLIVHARGQAFTPRRPFILQSASTVNTNPEAVLPYGMKFWYTAKDLSNSPVAEWTDRIQGYKWWQTVGAKQPTWTTNVGVSFDGVQQFLYATNGQVISNQTDATLTIFKFNYTTNVQMLIGNEAAAGRMFIAMDTANYFYEGNWKSAAVGPIGTATMDLITSPYAYHDFRVYTNGIEGMSGNRNVIWNNPSITLIGSGSNNAFANAVLKEWIVWTNPYGSLATNYWDATTVSNVHWYATNQWGGTL